MTRCRRGEPIRFLQRIVVEIGVSQRLHRHLSGITLEARSRDSIVCVQNLCLLRMASHGMVLKLPAAGIG